MVHAPLVTIAVQTANTEQGVAQCLQACVLTVYSMLLDQCLLPLIPPNTLKDVVVNHLGCVNPVQAVLQGNTCHRHARKIRLGCAPRVVHVQLAPTEQDAAVLLKGPAPTAR